LYRQPTGNVSGEADNYSAPGLIRIGCVSGAHGLRGAIRVRLDNPDSSLLQRVDRVTLAQQGKPAEYRLAGVQATSEGRYKVKLDGVTDADHAGRLRGASVMVAVDVLPPTTAGEFYYFQAVGCGVVTTKGSAVGIIEEVFFNGANEVWVIRSPGAEHLVPVVEDIVKEIDLSARRVVIEPVPGLLDSISTAL
jgi:16S rRNA processing protein RimM